jgi:hypothetical protein
VLSEVVQDPMVNIQNIRDICDELDGNCSACPFGAKEGCPFLSDDPMNWDVGYINKRHAHSPFNKNTGVTGNTRIIRVTSCLHDCPKYQLSDNWYEFKFNDKVENKIIEILK